MKGGYKIMKRDLSFGSLLTTITAGLFGIFASISPAFWGFANSMNTNTGKITHPEFFVGVVGCALLVALGLVAIILSIIGIFKKGKGLAITTLVFQGLLFVGALLAFIGGINMSAGADPEEIIMIALQCFLPFVALILAYAGAFVLNLFNVLRMKKEATSIETEKDDKVVA